MLVEAWRDQSSGESDIASKVAILGRLQNGEVVAILQTNSRGSKHSLLLVARLRQYSVGIGQNTCDLEGCSGVITAHAYMRVESVSGYYSTEYKTDYQHF